MTYWTVFITYWTVTGNLLDFICHFKQWKVAKEQRMMRY